MKICAVISEFDPFHNGHLVPLAKALESGCTHSVAVMSGNWTQCGEPAMFSKYARAEAAVRCGYDLVLELPAPYALSSSERFAMGGISLIRQLGCVDSIAFGSESGDADLIARTAEIIDKPNIKRRIDELCRLGETYPSARQKALEVFAPESVPAVSSPNDILAVDYMRAVKKLGLTIQPIAARRRGTGHDSLTPGNHFASGTYLRDLFRGDGLAERFLPDEALSVFTREMNAGRCSEGMDALSSALFVRLRTMEKQEFSEYPDCAGGLGDRIYSAAANSSSVSELYAAAKSRNFTMSRVKRAVACMFIGIKAGMNTRPVPYAHILAIGRNGDEVLKAISSGSEIKLSDSNRRLASYGADCAEFADLEARASELHAISMTVIPPRGSENDTRLYHL